MDTCHSDLQGLVQLLEVLPMCNLKPPALLQAAYMQWPIRWRHKGLATGCVRKPWGPPSSRDPMGSAKVVWAVSSLISPSTLSCFFRLNSTSVDPKGTPNTHPNINLHLNLYPREPTSNMYQKKKIPVLRFSFENHWLCTYLQHFKKPKKNTKR